MIRTLYAPSLRVLAVYGTRPEAIKMAPVIAALQRRPERFTVSVCPEEANRRMIDLLADVLFAPTRRASQILCDEE